MRKIILTAAAALLALGASAQKADPVIVEVAGQQVRQSEFMKEFLPTVQNRQQMSATEKRQAVNEYVELFANFRAKVADAKSMGMDTAASLERELKGYRDDLAAPYLIDSATLTRLIDEAYERNRYQLHAAHILVPCNPNAAAADTLAAYKHALQLRNRIVKGEDFYAVSREEVQAQHQGEPNFRVSPTEGDLGYFTVFEMVYPFESGAYALQPGEVSMPVRSSATISSNCSTRWNGTARPTLPTSGKRRAETLWRAPSTTSTTSWWRASLLSAWPAAATTPPPPKRAA